MPNSSSKSPDSKYLNQSVERAYAILRLFLGSDAELTASEISKNLSLPQSTVFRFLVTMEMIGFVERDPDNNKYRLGVTCLELGSAFLKSSDLRQRALPLLEAIRDETGETVHLGIVEEYQGVYLEKVAGLHPIGLMSSHVGARFPLYCTGLGKALLANIPENQILDYIDRVALAPYTQNTITDSRKLLEELNQIRQLGYARDIEEHERGVSCIAAPIFKHNGLAGAISIAGPANRINDPSSIESLIRQITQAAMEISVHLAGRQMKRMY